MAAITGSGVTMAGGMEPVQLLGQRVSAGYFDVFGARAALGRTFAPKRGNRVRTRSRSSLASCGNDSLPAIQASSAQS